MPIAADLPKGALIDHRLAPISAPVIPFYFGQFAGTRVPYGSNQLTACKFLTKGRAVRVTVIAYFDVSRWHELVCHVVASIGTMFATEPAVGPSLQGPRL